MNLIATLARALRAAAAALERFDARRAELRAFRLMAERNPELAAALIAASAGDERDAADSWSRIRNETPVAASPEVGDETAAAQRWADEIELTRALRFALRRYSPTEPPAQA